jgi:undecaprenyl-diphosphatase
MIEFDVSVILFLNQFARVSWALDHLIVLVSGSNLLKGGMLTALLWWLWFRPGEHADSSRSHIVATVAASLVAIAVARALALLLPFRLRPVHDPNLDLVLPYGAVKGMLESWSAFPSDHAVLFFALATGVWFVSRPLGALAVAYAIIVIALPRLYLGFHYPSDVIVGGLIGMVIAIVANSDTPRRYIAGPMLQWLHASPGSFYALLFLLSFQISVLFEDGRNIGKALYNLLRATL